MHLGWVLGLAWDLRMCISKAPVIRMQMILDLEKMPFLGPEPSPSPSCCTCSLSCLPWPYLPVGPGTEEEHRNLQHEWVSQVSDPTKELFSTRPCCWSGPHPYPTAQTPLPRPLAPHQGSLAGPQHLWHFPGDFGHCSESLSHRVLPPHETRVFVIPTFFPTFVFHLMGSR